MFFCEEINDSSRNRDFFFEIPTTIDVWIEERLILFPWASCLVYASYQAGNRLGRYSIVFRYILVICPFIYRINIEQLSENYRITNEEITELLPA